MRKIHAVHFIVRLTEIEVSDFALNGYEEEEIFFNQEDTQCTSEGTAIENPVYELSENGDCIRVIGTLEPEWFTINEFEVATFGMNVFSFYTDSELCAQAVVHAFDMGCDHQKDLDELRLSDAR